MTRRLDGEPWFVLADLCKVLARSNPSVYAKRLQSIGEVTRFYPMVDSLGRTQQATIVSEVGMYEVVIRSDKPEAAAFRRLDPEGYALSAYPLGDHGMTVTAARGRHQMTTPGSPLMVI